MKKVKRLVLLFVLLALALVVLTACFDDGGNSPKEPANPSETITLKKDTFAMRHNFYYENKSVYSLSWESEGGEAKYVIEFEDGAKSEVDFPFTKLYVEDFEANKVHTLKITAHSVDAPGVSSDTVEIKFKGVPLETPQNFSLDAEGFSWDAQSDYYDFKFEGVDVYGDPTGKDFHNMLIENEYSNSMAVSFMEYNGMFMYYEPHVRLMPHEEKRYEFANDTDVLEVEYPSAYTEEEFTLYANKMSNPSNVQCKLAEPDVFEIINVSWNAVDPVYKYYVKVDFQGYSSGDVVDGNITERAVHLDYRFTEGEYKISLISQKDDFLEKVTFDGGLSYVWMYYAEQEPDEIWSFSVDADGVVHNLSKIS